MTINKDFKKLVRARMEKTRESYTAARAALLKENANADPQYVDTTVYVRGIDGRWRAEEPDEPGVIGYGPSHRYAAIDQSRRSSVTRYAGTKLSALAAHVPRVAIVVRDRADRWTAYAQEDPATVVAGTNKWSALSALESKLPPRRGDHFTRTVVLEEHEDGRWSAQSDGDESCGAMTWGASRSEAEEKLMDEEETESFMNDSIEDYGSDPD
jgi:hypothetical protein